MLPESWVDEIFARLAVRYGSRWASMWQGLPVEAVRADWSDQLDGMTPDAIRRALASLPDDFPPTATAFRKLGAVRAEAMPAPVLPAPDPAGIKRIASAIAAGMPREVPLTQRAKECLDNLRAKVKAGAASPAQRDFLRRAEAGLGLTESAEDIGDFQPVPREVWPEAMRDAA